MAQWEYFQTQREAKAVSCDHSVGGLGEAPTYTATKSQVRHTMKNEYESERLFIHEGCYKQRIFHPY